MITKVQIQNFQSHKDTTINFVPGTNVVIGASDTGKSAVFRALNWAFSNRPLGDAFRSEWGGATRVIIHTAEGDIVERVKSSTRNEYVLNGEVLKAFGSDVPEQIMAVLCMDAANIQSQTDPAFLLAYTPGEAARMLNKAASIDGIDQSISHLKSVHGSIVNAIKFKEENLVKLRHDLERYENLSDIEEVVVQAEETAELVQVLYRRINDLRNLISGIDTITSQVENLSQIPVLVGLVKDVTERYNLLCEAVSWMKRIKQTCSRIEEVEYYFWQTKYVDTAYVLLGDLLAIYSQCEEQSDRIDELTRLIERIEGAGQKIHSVDSEIEGLEQEYYELAPESCPLCGNVLSKEV